MKKTHVPCSLKIEEEAVRYDLDNPTKRNTAKLLQLFLTALGYFGSVLVICDLYGTNIRKGIFLPLAVGGFLLASLLQFLPKHSGKLTLGFVLVLLGMSALFSKQIVLGFHAIFNVVYQTAHNTNIAYFQIAKRANITFAATLTGTLVAELLAFLFAFFTIRKPHFTLPTAVSFLLAEPGLYLGIPVSVPAMGLLLAYWGGMLALRFPALWGREKIRCTQRTSAIGGSLTALLILLVYGAVSPDRHMAGGTAVRNRTSCGGRRSVKVWRISTFRICPRAFARSLRQSAWATTRLSPSETLPSSGYTTGQI